MGAGFSAQRRIPLKPNRELKAFERCYEKLSEVARVLILESCVRFATASCVALALLAQLVEPVPYPPLSLCERSFEDLLAEGLDSIPSEKRASL